MTYAADFLTAARAEALFSSDLPTGSCLTCDEVGAAIEHALQVQHGARGCAMVLAGEYGEHPETAVPRMRWALRTVRAAYAERLSGSAA